MTEEKRNEVSIVDLIKSFYYFKFQILLISFSSAFVFFISSFFVTTLYTNKSFVIINEEMSQPEFDSPLSALASFGGIELPGSNKNDEFIAIVKSKKFIYSFLKKKIFCLLIKTPKQRLKTI